MTTTFKSLSLLFLLALLGTARFAVVMAEGGGYYSTGEGEGGGEGGGEGEGGYLYDGEEEQAVAPVEEKPSSNELQVVEKVQLVNGLWTYIRKFRASGLIAQICLDLDVFCDLSAAGDAAFLSCYAARKALAAIQASYAFEGRLSVTTGKNGKITSVDLKTDGIAGVMAISIAETATKIKAKTTVKVEADTEASAPLTQTAAAALGGSYGQSISYAYARNLGQAGSETLTSTQVRVKGVQIRKFEGDIASAAASFVLSDSYTKGLAEAASRAYSAALSFSHAESEKSGKTHHELAVEYKAAAALSTAFGDALASAVGEVGVTFGFHTVITESEQGVLIGLKGGRYATVACGTANY